VGVFPGGTDGI